MYRCAEVLDVKAGDDGERTGRIRLAVCYRTLIRAVLERGDPDIPFPGLLCTSAPDRSA